MKLVSIPKFNSSLNFVSMILNCSYLELQERLDMILITVRLDPDQQKLFEKFAS